MIPEGCWNDFRGAVKAAKGSDVESARAYIEGCHDLDMQNDKDGLTLFHYAVCFENIEVASLLLKQPSLDPNIPDLSGCSPLHSIVESGQGQEMIAFLLASEKINPNQRDNQGYSILHSAVVYNPDAVDILLADPRVDVNIRNKSGRTPFLAAVQQMFFEEYLNATSISVVEKFLGHPRLDTHIIFDGEQDGLPKGTALDKLLMFSFSASLFDQERSFCNFCQWGIALGKQLVNHESQRLKDNDSKVTSLIDQLPALRDPINRHCRPFLNDELKQRVLSPESIKYIKDRQNPKWSKCAAEMGDFMKFLQRFIEKWGDPDQFDFDGLVNGD